MVSSDLDCPFGIPEFNLLTIIFNKMESQREKV